MKPIHKHDQQFLDEYRKISSANGKAGDIPLK
jgi:hypothetical protein